MRRILLLLPVLVLSLFCASTAAKRDDGALFRYVLAEHVVKLDAQDGFCSAVMVAKDTLLTANHCTDTLPLVAVDQLGVTYPVDVLKQNEVMDLALLHSRVATKTPIQLGTLPEDAAPVMAIGYSALLESVVPGFTAGHVLTTYHGVLVVVDSVFKRGFSGGPLIDANGKLIGISVMSDGQHNLGFAVSLKVIYYFLEDK